ncbi:hypothetical protein GOBAR_AA06924 [Gossypium barbadense]|uniref:Uncharacterized protein n=1 Tax=Gossypium barbadense TaxID=3634 RepID=A0A2P5YDG4_GOSBA|nr:hypothetical protein GOBAR_AA06924 [Gossypium barbadense]
MKQSLFKLETRSKSTHELCSSNNKGPIYEERRLRVEELDEWQTHKLRTHDKPKPCHDKLNISPNQLKVGDKVLLDTADPRIATSELNGEIPLTVLSIFPYDTVKVIHPKFVQALLTTDPWGLFFEIVKPTYLELTIKIYSTFHLQVVISEFDDPGTVQFCLSELVRQLSVPEFNVALGLYTKEFMDDDDFDTLHLHIHLSPSNCWRALVPTSATYDPSQSKASAFTPSLRYLHAFLAQALTGRRSDIGEESSPLALFHPPQYLLVQSAEEEDLEDITDDVPPQHEDPPSQPLPIHHLVRAMASYSDISERLTQFDYKGLQSSSSPRNLKLHWKWFSTTAMSWSTTTITSSLDIVVLEPNLYHHQSILLQSYVCRGRLFSITPIQGVHSSFRKFHFSPYVMILYLYHRISNFVH